MPNFETHPPSPTPELEETLRALAGQHRNDPITCIAGEFNNVLLSNELVLKVPTAPEEDANRKTSLFEAAIVDALNEQAVEPPLDIPRVAQVQATHPPYYSVFRQVPGQVLAEADLRHLALMPYALDAAIETYENAANAPLSSNLLRF